MVSSARRERISGGTPKTSRKEPRPFPPPRFRLRVSGSDIAAWASRRDVWRLPGEVAVRAIRRSSLPQRWGMASSARKPFARESPSLATRCGGVSAKHPRARSLRYIADLPEEPTISGRRFDRVYGSEGDRRNSVSLPRTGLPERASSTELSECRAIFNRRLTQSRSGVYKLSLIWLTKPSRRNE